MAMQTSRQVAVFRIVLVCLGVKLHYSNPKNQNRQFAGGFVPQKKLF